MFALLTLICGGGRVETRLTETEAWTVVVEAGLEDPLQQVSSLIFHKI